MDEKEFLKAKQKRDEYDYSNPYDEKTKKDFRDMRIDIQEALKIIDEAEEIFKKSESEARHIYPSSIRRVAERLTDGVRFMMDCGWKMEEYIGRLPENPNEEPMQIYRNSPLKRNTKVDSKDLNFEFEKTGNVIKIHSNFRCPHIRSVAYQFKELAAEVQQKFNKSATDYFGVDEHSEATGRPRNKMIGCCYMIFVHHYRDLDKYRRDVDNYFEKPLSDAISKFFILGGDEPRVVRRLSMAITDKENYTDVYLVPENEFPSWITDFHEELRRRNLTELERMSEDLFKELM